MGTTGLFVVFGEVVGTVGDVGNKTLGAVVGAIGTLVIIAIFPIIIIIMGTIGALVVIGDKEIGDKEGIVGVVTGAGAMTGNWGGATGTGIIGITIGSKPVLESLWKQVHRLVLHLVQIEV